jgi:TolB-like protein/DNA-binding winged helix-turn-helix (wHTH) protein/Flp pilus assembly protein TadD
MTQEKIGESGAHANSFPPEARFSLGEWTVDPATNRLSRDGRQVRLEPKVMRVLVFLAERPGRVIKRRELEAAVWPGMLVSDDAVTNTVIKLRRALGDSARHSRYIETIAKSGYRLIAKVDRPAAPPEEPPRAVRTRAEPAAGTPRSRLARAIPALLTAVPLIALAIGWWLTQSRPGPATPAETARPVVAVLPFEDLSGDPARGYFPAGLTEDLITDLSKLAGLQVVARNSVLPYRGSDAPASRIGADLGADYLVRGSVQRAGQRLRINVRLVAAAEDRNRWAERYDRPLVDVFGIQDDIVTHVISAIQVELGPGERGRLARAGVASVEAYDAFLRGLDLLGRRESADNAEARGHFLQAIDREPRFARAYAGLAMTYALRAVYGHGAEVMRSLDRAEAIAREGMAIDENVPQLRYALALTATYRGNLAEAMTQVERAIELRPSYADAYGLQAWILYFAGRPLEGLDAMERAVALNPRVPALYLTVEAALHYQLGDLEEAGRLLRASAEINPNQLLTRLFLAAVHAAGGNLEAARWEVAELRALEPDFELDLDHGFPIRDPAYRERLLRDLGRVGLTTR